jgi:hypothetical protein
MQPARALLAPLLALLPAADRPAVVADEQIAAVVPARGETVWVETVEPDGDFDMVVVTHRADGGVTVARLGDQEPLGGLAVATTLPACADAAFTSFTHHVKDSFPWSFATSSTPWNITPTKAVAAAKRAAVNVVGTENDCKLPDGAEVEQSYAGAAKAGPNITSASVCGTRDGRSVVGFGDLSSSHLGLACWWTRDGVLVEGDIKLNKVDFRWTIWPAASCKGRYAVEAVLTHEFGHVFGLDHVSEDLHGELTMSPLMASCQLSETTLGAGDVAGLAAKYHLG